MIASDRMFSVSAWALTAAFVLIGAHSIQIGVERSRRMDELSERRNAKREAKREAMPWIDGGPRPRSWLWCRSCGSVQPSMWMVGYMQANPVGCHECGTELCATPFVEVAP